MQFILWTEWSKAFSELRVAFSRQRTFLWAAVFCAGLSVRTSLRGVSAIVDELNLDPKSYASLIRLCQSGAIDLERLINEWIKLCLKLFKPVTIGEYLVVLGDGIKIAKEGKKMPAVKLMHQSSQSNKKAEYIMGHYFQAFSLLVKGDGSQTHAIPIKARIHDGIVLSNRCKKTVMNRFAGSVDFVSKATGKKVIVVADAYYANKSVVGDLEKGGSVLVSRVAHNATAHLPLIAVKNGKRGRGRPKSKGEKVKLSSYFSQLDQTFGKYRYKCVDLYWGPAKRLTRFVVVEHETKGRIILMSSKTDLCPQTIIELYVKRWQIEVDFKTAVHHIGSFSYRFWMQEMKPSKRKTKQYLHRESEEYREAALNKVEAYEIFATFGCITQGLLKFLAIKHSDEVWRSFKGWLRTIRNNSSPSEAVVSQALKRTLVNFIKAPLAKPAWAIFMRQRIDQERRDLCA